MKKLFSLFALSIFMISIISCSSDDDYIAVDYDTYPVAYDLRNVNLELINGVYQTSRTFTNPMYETDMLLIYKSIGSTDDGYPIWQQIPITFYLEGGHELDYNFDFTRYDFVIYAGGTFDLTGTPYVQNQTFRVLIIPASYGRNSEVNFEDYQSVIEFYQIDDSNPVGL